MGRVYLKLGGASYERTNRGVDGPIMPIIRCFQIMYVRIYVSVFVCGCARARARVHNTYIYMYVCTYIYIYIYIYMYVCMYLCSLNNAKHNRVIINNNDAYT